MKKLKTMLFICLLTAMNSLQAQTYDIYDLESSTYQTHVTGNDYTTAITKAITDANANGGGIILFPGNTPNPIEIKNVLNVYSNITFKASHSIATIKCSDDFSVDDNQMIVLGNRQNVTFDGIKFDANNKAIGIGVYGTSNSNINIKNCVFENASKTDKTYSAIYMQNVSDVNIENCVFRDSYFGITFRQRNSRIRIDNNTFEETLDNSPIYILGTQNDTISEFSSDVWIRSNNFRIGRSVSIIDDETIVDANGDRLLIRDPQTGAVSGLRNVDGLPPRFDENNNPIPADADYVPQYWNWRNGNAKGHYAINITCSSDTVNSAIYHENIVIENNIAVGPDYGFFDGGSGDLYGLKDIVRLKCVNNVARNSGDLGFAIVNCSSAVISGNTADRNNSFGIAIVDTRNSVITGNVLENNALRRDYMYNSSPYGGLLIAGGKSYNNIIEGNHFFGFANIDPSSQNNYEIRTSPTDFYGIVIRSTYDDTGGTSYENAPFLNNIGNNHYAGQKWGTIYNQVPSTQLSDDFTAISFPTNRDYPLGTWIRNSNLNNSALGWSVINRVETQLHQDWIIPTQGNLPPIKILDNNDTDTVQVGDIIGIMLNDGSVHWSVINAITLQIGHYNVELAQYPTQDITDVGITDPSTANNNFNMDRIVILRWLTVTK